MGASEITVGELLYEAAVDFTEVVEYGVSLGAVLAGNIAVRRRVHASMSVFAAPCVAEIERNSRGR